MRHILQYPLLQSATPGPSSPALSTVSSTAYSSYSAYSSTSSTYGGSASFPSLAESREVAMMESGGISASSWSPSASHAHFASNPRGSGHSHSNHGPPSGPVSKIQAFTELTDERRAHLSAKFRFDPALLAPILAHFLKYVFDACKHREYFSSL
jgi:hypothetical protein